MADISAIKLPSGTTYNLKDANALPLTGGNVTGPVIFGDSITVDEATLGDLVVNGNASFTNNIQANTINGVVVGSNPEFTDTTYSAGTGLSLNATTFNHSNSVTAQNTQGLYPIAIDAQGHINSYGTAATAPTVVTTIVDTLIDQTEITDLEYDSDYNLYYSSSGVAGTSFKGAEYVRVFYDGTTYEIKVNSNDDRIGELNVWEETSLEWNYPFTLLWDEYEEKYGLCFETQGPHQIKLENITKNITVPSDFELAVSTIACTNLINDGDTNVKSKSSTITGVAEHAYAFGENNTIENASGSMTLGWQNTISGYSPSFICGDYNTVSGGGATFGSNNNSSSTSFATGVSNTASGHSFAAGGWNTASGNYSFATGVYNTASGQTSHVEGGETTSSLSIKLTGDANATTYTVSGFSGKTKSLIGATISSSSSNAQNSYAKTASVISETVQNVSNITSITVSQTLSTSAISSKTFYVVTNNISSGKAAHAEGIASTATGDYSHSEGYITKASATSAHSEGYGTTASATYSHAEGHLTTASGTSSHAEGDGTTASGYYAHAEGYGTTAKNKSQHVFGEFNIEDPTTYSVSSRGRYLEIAGNGTGSSAKSNARTLDWNGNEILAGKLTVGAAPTADMDVTTKQYVDTQIPKVYSSTNTDGYLTLATLPIYDGTVV